MKYENFKVYIAGDSTVQTYKESDFPQAGWGQFISMYFTEKLEFVNKSIGGRSSKTFIKEGRLEKILEVIKENDYLLIQMGHNDASIDKPERFTEPTIEYKKYLKIYLDSAREKEAIPILITPVATLKFDGKHFANEFEKYCISMKELAVKENIKCIDLMKESLEYFEKVGYDYAYKMFMISNNKTDCTHFTHKGAKNIAEILSKELVKIDNNFSKYYI